jgi:hypothetical protein
VAIAVFSVLKAGRASCYGARERRVVLLLVGAGVETLVDDLRRREENTRRNGDSYFSSRRRAKLLPQKPQLKVGDGLLGPFCGCRDCGLGVPGTSMNSSK